jgi:hypothetical protein
MLKQIQDLCCTLLPCLTLLLSTLLKASNDYELKKGVEKRGKDDMAAKTCISLELRGM